MCLAIAGPADAAASEVAPTSCTKSIGGTLRGEDGRYLSAFVGVTFFDSLKRPIAAAACSDPKPGYDGSDSLNEQGTCCYLLDAEGASSGEQAWSIPAPGNAVYAWIEAYPKSKSAPDGPHRTSYERYGAAMRRYVALSGSIALRLPLGCGLGAGGDNGAVAGFVLQNGRPVAVTRIAAFSRAPDGTNPIMGFGVQGQPGTSDGRFRFTQLSPDQRYALNVTTSVGTFWFENDYGSGVAVRPCSTTLLTLDVGTAPHPTVVPTVGRDSVGLRRDATVLLSDTLPPGGVDHSYSYGLGSDQVLVGDWDGDGIDTIGVRRDGVFYLSNSPDANRVDLTVRYGTATDVGIVGDWDGNGTDTIGVRRGTALHLRNSNTGGLAQISFSYGLGSDTLLIGDWNGNRSDSIGIRRGATFHLRNQNSSGPAQMSFSYGVASDSPLTGDWDRNGTDTPGVRRGATFYLRNSNTSGNAHIGFSHGQADDVPIVGDWDGL